MLAWVVLAVVLFGVYKAASAWKNPWAVGGAVPAGALVNPVLSNLPASGAGCGEKCRD